MSDDAHLFDESGGALTRGYRFFGKRVSFWVNKVSSTSWTTNGTALGLAIAAAVLMALQLAFSANWFGFVLTFVSWIFIGLILPAVIGSSLPIPKSIQHKREIDSWLEKLASAGARRANFSFKPLSVSRPFLIQFSFRVLLEKPKSNPDMLRVRAGRNRDVNEEMAEIESRLNEMIGAFANNLNPHVLQCADSGFWRSVENGLNFHLGPRIEDEFGCRIQITDLRRDKNPLEDELDRLTDPDLKNQVESSLKLLHNAEEHYGEVLAAHGYNIEDENVVQAESAAVALRKRLEDVKRSVNESALAPARELPTMTERTDLLNRALSQIVESLSASSYESRKLRLQGGAGPPKGPDLRLDEDGNRPRP